MIYYRRSAQVFVAGCVLALSTTPVNGAQAQGSDCVACHIDQHIPQIKPDENSCNTCHQDKTPQHVAQSTAAGSNQQNKGLPPGMRLPLFYSPSRLGDKPNEMVLIPAGSFTMGTDERLSDEGPAHKVELPAFYIDRYEVTNLQYKAFIDASNHRSPSHFVNRDFPEGKSDHPVTYVTWQDAVDYCQWAGKRLPSDAEWEKAARGTDARSFPWGEEFNLHAANTPVRWEALKQEGDTTPVGAFEAGVSPYGLYDMSGNVWEWTSSWYENYPGNTKPSENYGEIYKTLKGGSWWDCSFYQCGISAPSYNRSFFLRTTKNSSFGFRCAKDAK